MLKKGILWDFIGKFFKQGIGFIISIFLARLLTPEDFGLVGMVMAFVAIAQIFVDMGFGTALVQREKVEEIHFSSVFWLNISIALIITLTFFWGAELIADFYHREELIPIVKVMSLLFIIYSLGIVNRSQLLRNMDFKSLSIINVFATLISGIVGVGMALTGYGVWAIIIQSLLSGVVTLSLLWLRTKWIPSFIWSLDALKPLWNFGYKLFISGVIQRIFDRLDVFIIGKMFTPSDLGFFTRSKSLNQLVVDYSSGSISSVLFPALSKKQNDPDQIKTIVVKALQVVGGAAFLISGLLFISAEEIIVFLFTDKWLPAVPYFKILLLSTYAYPLNAIIMSPIQSLGRTDVVLKLQLMKKSVLLSGFIIGFIWGINGYLYSLTIVYIINLLLNSYFLNKLIILPKSKLTIELIKQAISTIISAYIILHFHSYFSEILFLRIIINSTFFSVLFLLINYIFKTHFIKFVLNTIVQLYSKYKQ
ncbi:lipopolysaccharide biosynthesis protein [Vicingus serpentipes]|uniref:Lipopolysaccharide biosynthesis protein n=1 Tax=Vicingus serpentipes TaxID=1926625 RepID=A0A5C6RNB5_9FLAO|nr:lipopolysaccharide biosynthesis protein [Vicingus serpentipes]TXB63697.1 lipopolysaccharide biosynthesis protein [Vicingus serpentipes]